VFIGALGGVIYARVPRFLGLDPEVYNYDACSRDAAAMNSEKGQGLDRQLRQYCAERSCHEVETALNKAQIGCALVFSTQDQYTDAHYSAREMTVRVPDWQSGVPKLSLTPGGIWRDAPPVGEDTSDILAKMLGLPEADIAGLYANKVVHRTEPFTSAQVDAVHR
jgi:crotonobetainyl-CoA:carnitine CoA-transferase CaiB-like acyl-CoA transferase